MPLQKPSIIFNQYAKKAIEKGWIPSSHIKKTASEKEKIVPTGELIIDFPILIAQLKNKGLYDQAKSLEQKFILYKQAETHLYRVHDEDGEDVLNLAHPGKNVEIGKASEGLGVVNSLLEKHDKMVNVLSKKPTGKYAEFIRDIVVEAAEILHPELAKFAQANPILDEEPSTEDILTELNVDPETKQKIDSANSTISEKLTANLPNLESALQSTGLTDQGVADWAVLTEDKLLKGVGEDFYLKANKIDKGKFDKYTSVFWKLFPDGNASAETISKIIYSLKTFDGMLSFFNQIDPRVADQWFGGSEIKGIPPQDTEALTKIQELAQTDKRFINKPLSVWVMNFGMAEPKLNGAKVGFAAQGIVGWMNQWKAELIDQAKIDNANKMFSTQAKPIYGAVKNVFNTLSPDSFLKSNKIRKTTGLAVGALKSAIGISEKTIEYVAKNKSLYESFGLINFDVSIISYLKASNKIISALVEEVSQFGLAPILDNPINGVLANSIISTFKEIGASWGRYYESESIKDEDKPTVENNIRQAQKVFNIVAKNYDKPWAYLQQFVIGTFPKATTPEKLLQIGQEGLKYVRGIVPKTASEKKTLIKEADFGQLSGKPAQVSSGGQKTQTQSSGKSTNVGLAKANLSDPTQLAVANMQLALNVFGQIISNPDTKVKFPKANFDPNDGLRIIGTGPKANPHINMFDGHWGPNTDAALVLANKYLQSIGTSVSTGVKWNQGSRSHSEGTGEAAKANSIALSKAISYVKGEKSSDKSGYADSTVFDSLPETINWSADPGEASLTGEQQTVKLIKANLASLRSFYDFLTKNRLREAETSGASETEIGTEGFTPKSWNVVFQWFQRRAVLKYQSAKAIGEAAANQAKEYFNSIKRLSNIYDKMLSVYSKYIKEDTVINPGLIDEFSRKVQSGEISTKSGDPNEAQIGMWLKSKKKTGKPGEIGSDGERIKSPEERGNTLPFADTINFRDEELFSDFDAGGNTLVQLADMQKVPGPRMAQMLFAGSVAPKMAQKAAIKLLGQNPTTWSEESNTWLVQSGKSAVPATSLLSSGDITNVTQQIMQNAPVNKYRTFLNNLSVKIKDVMQEWSQDAPEALIVKLSSYYKYWQQAIAKQLRDLAR